MKPLIVNGNIESLDDISQYVMNVANEASLDQKSAYKLRLAVDEISTNIITHGYEESGISGKIIVQGDIKMDQVIITIEDTGIPYDPTKKTFDQDLDLPLEERQIGGLGIFLARDGVDEFLYEREGNINRNILIIKT